MSPSIKRLMIALIGVVLGYCLGVVFGNQAQANEFTYQMVENHSKGVLLIPVSDNSLLSYDDWYDCFVYRRDGYEFTMYITDANDVNSRIIETDILDVLDYEELEALYSQRTNKGQ